MSCMQREKIIIIIIVLGPDQIMIVVEMVHNGDLHEYLLSLKPK